MSVRLLGTLMSVKLEKSYLQEGAADKTPLVYTCNRKRAHLLPLSNTDVVIFYTLYKKNCHNLKYCVRHGLNRCNKSTIGAQKHITPVGKSTIGGFL